MYIKCQMSGPDQEDFKCSNRGVTLKVKRLHIRKDFGFAMSVQPAFPRGWKPNIYQQVQENPPGQFKPEQG